MDRPKDHSLFGFRGYVSGAMLVSGRGIMVESVQNFFFGASLKNKTL